MPELSFAEMPILRQLVYHTGRFQIPMHVPGHKQGRLLPGELGQWFAAAGKLDLTELPGLDNLHLPEGCILESEQKAAAFYGADKAYYSVNGSTAAVMAAILAVGGDKGKVLFLNSPHLSAWRGLVLADANAVFAPVQFDAFHLTEQAPDLGTLEKLLERERFDCVFVTSPTYTGVISPVAEIAQLVHRFHTPLVVDEAHGAHLGLTPDLPPHSIQAGADVVVHSVHKMLPGLTQTAWLLCQGDLVHGEQVESTLSLLQTTSPSYLLLASLDAVQAWLRIEGKDRVNQGLQNLIQLSDLPHRQDLKYRDPFRDWVPTGNLEQSRDLQNALAKQGIAVEYADAFGVLSLFALDAPHRELTLYREVLLNWLSSRPPVNSRIATVLFSALGVERRNQLSFRAAYFGHPRWVTREEAIGQLCARPITPYPPGVPLLWPGQEITAFAAEVLDMLQQGGYEVHGLNPRGELPVLTGL